ncbi:hypothetical protein [Altererythrobacter sp. MTPC7]|uniref:hypothetical protein n=1 Tax=Altererythrobacter sp. MTPC7 TaxID=3056567 RepID=UPI0036F3E8B9
MVDLRQAEFPGLRLRPAGKQFPRCRDLGEKFRQQDVAFGHVDDAVRAFLAEADDDPLPHALEMQRGAPAGARKRKMRRRDGFGRQALPLCRQHDAVAHEGGQRVFAHVLQLARTAFREVAAWRLHMIGPLHQRAVGCKAVARHAAGHVLPVRSHAVAACGDPDYRVLFVHRALA